MEFVLAKTAGFCWGVRRALNKTLEVDVPPGTRVTTLGPLVHNPQVIDLLKHRDIGVAKTVEEIQGGVAIIRTHGVSPQVRAELESRAEKIFDQTCPVVVKVQKLVDVYKRKGHFVVIYGEPHHPEVQGLIGFAGEGNSIIIDKAEDLYRVKEMGHERIILVTQTTTNVAEWNRTMALARQEFPEVVVKDTMCDATIERQDDILELCRQVEAMIVIGGKNSGNTTRLAQIAAEEFRLPTWHIESEDELMGVDFTPYAKIGVTAGASTPAWSIDRVMAYLKTLEDRSKNPVLSKIKAALSTTVVTNVFTSLAAGALCYVGAALQGVPFSSPFFWLVFCYVLSMHVLNRFTERNLDQFRDDPARVRFYEKHGKLMRVIGVGSGAVALAISVWMGVLPFLLILGASVIGVLYSVKIVPKRFMKTVGFRRLKDIAASKNFFVASAWAMVSIFPIFFLSANPDLARTVLAFAFLFVVTAMRSVVVDLTDMNADRLVGRETLPLVLGEKKTARFLLYAAGGLGAGPMGFAAIGMFPLAAWALGAWVLAELVYLMSHPPTFERGVVMRDLVVDSHFLAAAVLTFLLSRI